MTGGSTVHTINIEIRATGAVSPEIPSRVFVISLHTTQERARAHTHTHTPGQGLPSRPIEGPERIRDGARGSSAVPELAPWGDETKPDLRCQVRCGHLRVLPAERFWVDGGWTVRPQIRVDLSVLQDASVREENRGSAQFLQQFGSVPHRDPNLTKCL